MSFLMYIKKTNRRRNIKTKMIKNQIKLSYMKLFYRPQHADLSICSNVCIFMHGQAIGDIIIASGLIEKLKKANKKVYIVAPERVRFLFENIIKIDGFYPFNKKNVPALVKNLKKLDIDLVIDNFDFDHTIMFRLKSLFKLKPKCAIGFDQPKNTIYDINLKSKDDTHLSERFIQILEVMKMDTNDYKYQLSFDDENCKIAHDYANSIKYNKKLIVFNPFASQKIRSLSINQVNDILKYLNTLKDYKTIVFDMGVKIDCDHFDNIELNPFKDAEKSFALASNADIIITVDTAIVHLASAFGIKQYCIYNNRVHNLKQNNNILFGPNNENASQLTTADYVNTEEGDDMHKFDISLLKRMINRDLNI